jgi:hypothetical protein
MPHNVIISNLKKYKINFNTVCFNYKTGMYEDNEEAYQTYSEASKNKWKCEKCIKNSEVTECYMNIRFKFIHIKIYLLRLNISNTQNLSYR